MTHYVLVHGAWEGAWSWDETLPGLKQHGNRVTVVDLPGSGPDDNDISAVTFDSYVQSVVSTISALGEKVVLAGHSMAGVVISQVAEAIPEKIEKLIYVTAFLLKSGDSVIEAMQRDPDGEFLPLITFADDQSSASAAEPVWRNKAFHDVTEDSTVRVLPRVVNRAQATEPLMAKINVSHAKFGSVPKTYIRTSLDKMVSPTLQNEMLENWDVEQIHTMQSGHFPTLSMPEQLAELMR